jgi:hypothetical protein
MVCVRVFRYSFNREGFKRATSRYGVKTEQRTLVLDRKFDRWRKTGEYVMPVTQDDIRMHLGAHSEVLVQIAGTGDGSPEIAWGDTFFYVRNANGEPPKMPFATIVTKDYESFDCDSNLNRGGLYRLNMDVGKEKLEELFGVKPGELQQNRGKFDFTSVDQLFPHPIYGPNGWVSIINPQVESSGVVNSLMDFSLKRALRRAAV